MINTPLSSPRNSGDFSDWEMVGGRKGQSEFAKEFYSATEGKIASLMAAPDNDLPFFGNDETLMKLIPGIDIEEPKEAEKPREIAVLSKYPVLKEAKPEEDFPEFVLTEAPMKRIAGIDYDPTTEAVSKKSELSRQPADVKLDLNQLKQKAAEAFQATFSSLTKIVDDKNSIKWTERCTQANFKLNIKSNSAGYDFTVTPLPPGTYSLTPEAFVNICFKEKRVEDSFLVISFFKKVSYPSHATLEIPKGIVSREEQDVVESVFESFKNQIKITGLQYDAKSPEKLKALAFPKKP